MTVVVTSYSGGTQGGDSALPIGGPGQLASSDPSANPGGVQTASAVGALSVQSADSVPDDSPPSFRQAFWDLSKLGVPMSLTFTISFEIFAAGLMLAHLSDESENKAAVTLVSAFMTAVLNISFSPLFALSVIISNKVGDYRAAEKEGVSAKDLQAKRERISGIFRSGIILAVILSVPPFLLMYFSGYIFSEWFHQDQKVSEYAGEFVRAFSPSAFAILMRIAFEQPMFAYEKVTPAMYFGLSTFTVGTLLAVWWGFGGLGVAPMGRLGVARGYVVETYLLSLVYGCYVASQKDMRKFKFFKLCGYKPEATKGAMRELLAQGIPITVTFVNEFILTLVLGVVAGLVGVNAQAALSHVLQFAYLMFVPIGAFGLAAMQEIGRRIGEKRYKNASRFARYTPLIALLWVIPACVVIGAYPDALDHMLGKSDPTISRFLKVLAPIMVAGIVLDSSRYSMLQSSRSLADPWGSTMVSALGLGMGLVLAGVLSQYTELEVYGIGVGYTAGFALSLMGLSYRWYHHTQISHVQTVNYKLAHQPTLFEYIRTCVCCKKPPEDAKGDAVPLIDEDHKQSYGGV